jgi:hypothetical protein
MPLFQRQMGPYVVLLATVLAMAGHICALPAHGHDLFESSTTDRHDSRGDAFHTASCDGVVVRSDTVTTMAASAPAPSGREEEAPRAPILDARRRSGPSESPPLFLLHAALLI